MASQEFQKGNDSEDEITLAGIAQKYEVGYDTLVQAAELKQKQMLSNADYHDEVEQMITDDGKGRQRPPATTKASPKLQGILNNKAAKAAVIAGAAVSAIALLIINAPIALGAAAVALIGNEVNKGRKGR